MNKKEIKTIISKRVAKEFSDGDVVNLGIGLPTLVANYVDDEINIILQSENGFIGMAGTPPKGKEDPNLTNAGGQPVTIRKNAAFFDSSISFSIIRGGHVDYTVLGALQVDQKGNLANWMIPNKFVPGMGGAMDLVTGSKYVIIAMTHMSRGKKKILKKCSLPLTAANEVDMIVTEMGVMKIKDGKIVLTEKHPDVTIEDIKKKTEAELVISENLMEMKIN